MSFLILALGRQRQPSQSYIVGPCLKMNKQKKNINKMSPITDFYTVAMSFGEAEMEGN